MATLTRLECWDRRTRETAKKIKRKLGEKERALDELERAYQRGDTNYLYVVRVDPMLGDLRGHPRFDALVQKIVDGK